MKPSRAEMPRVGQPKLKGLGVVGQNPLLGRIETVKKAVESQGGPKGQTSRPSSALSGSNIL